jgi:hypothetical protein
MRWSWRANRAPGRRAAPGLPFSAAGAAIVCGHRAGPAGVMGVRFARRAGASPNLRATVAFASGRNTLTVERAPGRLDAAVDLAAEVVTGLLADHGVEPGRVDAVVATPLDPAIHARLADTGLPTAAFTTVPGAGRVHTAALGVGLQRAQADGGLDGRTVVLVSTGAGPVAGAAVLRSVTAAALGREAVAQPVRGPCRAAGEPRQRSGLGGDAQAVERHGEHLVVADQQVQLDDLVLGQLAGQLAPGRVGDDPPVVQLVGRLEQQPAAAAPAARRRPGDHPVDVARTQPGPPGEVGVLHPLVPRPAPPRCTEDDELALRPRQVAP